MAETDPAEQPDAPSFQEPVPPTSTATPTPEVEDSTDWKAEATKWKSLARKNETTAKNNVQYLQSLIEKLGGDSKDKEFNPEAAIAELNSRFEAERMARLRSEVARTEGVDPEDFSGETEEDMRASAQKYKAKLQAAITAAVEAAQKGKVPAAVPASEVTANGKVAGPNQITSQDDLKRMTHQEILKARDEGRLDYLMGKTKN